ncbi:cytochrome c oxidase subunit II [Zavarzinia sp. CC-PAN008]|uniref:cytochrome c oxidase subunit II n=1 Tax=Zavarzinia sp. CC-PAN008 TaxID=3243332 RepID=UPI003F74AA69
MRSILKPIAPALLGTLWTASAWAEPQPWEIDFPAAASAQMQEYISFHNLLLVIITVITLFVAALLVYAMVRFRRSRNPVASKTSHNTLIEVIWTVVPVIILAVIFVPSMRILYYTDRTPDAEMTLKVTGHQWYWTYEYPDHENLTFDAYMVQDGDLKPGQLRLLSTDNEVVVPVDTNIRVLTTSTDVIHSWLVPALGVQKYAMPGRINETWFRATETGTVYGQCNQICGVNHGFMPVQVRVVSKEEFAAWLVEAKQRFASAGQPATQLAAVEAR